jgi:hypothetical protein
MIHKASDICQPPPNACDAPVPWLVILLTYPHCLSTPAPLIICSGCGAPLASPVNGPFDPAISGTLDWVLAVHDCTCTRQLVQEVLP